MTTPQVIRGTVRVETVASGQARVTTDGAEVPAPHVTSLYPRAGLFPRPGTYPRGA